MPYGYNYKILRVDLSQRRTDTEERDEVFYRTYPGGKGIGSCYFPNELRKGVDALGPENKLILAAGLITDAPVPVLCRYSAVSKDPLTCRHGESEARGWWGPALKMAGFDAIVCAGKAVLNLPVVGMWVKLLKLPFSYLFPLIVLFCRAGVYTINNSIFGIGLMLVFGMIGYVLRKVDYESRLPSYWRMCWVQC